MELTWYGKDQPIKVEPRLLIERAELSNTALDPDAGNMLIHGDNLLALKALESRKFNLAEKVLKGKEKPALSVEKAGFCGAATQI